MKTRLLTSAIALAMLAPLAAPASAQSYAEQQRWDAAQQRYQAETDLYNRERDRYYATRDRYRAAPPPGPYGYAPPPPPPAGNYGTTYDAARDYRDEPLASARSQPPIC